MTTRIAVLADTHIRRNSTRRLPAAAYRRLEQSDLILHAGDVLVPELLAELAEIAPVRAVLGNNDHELVGRLPERSEFDVDGVSVGLVHDSGPRRGRPGRMRRWFPDADLVVFGHSHDPVDEVGVEGQRLFNPGSPTERRRAPTRTMGMVTVSDGHIRSHRVVDVGEDR